MTVEDIFNQNRSKKSYRYPSKIWVMHIIMIEKRANKCDKMEEKWSRWSVWMTL